MTTYIVYMRYRNHIERKYESAPTAFDATVQALRYFRGSSVVKVVCLQ